MVRSLVHSERDDSSVDDICCDRNFVVDDMANSVELAMTCESNGSGTGSNPDRRKTEDGAESIR